MTSLISSSLPSIPKETIHDSLPSSSRLHRTVEDFAASRDAETASAPSSLRGGRGPAKASFGAVDLPVAAAAAVSPAPAATAATPDPMGQTSSRKRYAITCEEMSKNVANRIYYSTAYQVLYISMITINLAIITTVIQWDNYPDHTMFFVMEVIINTVFITEIVIRMIALRRAFWTQWSNWFDVIVAVISVVILIVFHNEGYEDVLEVALLITRYVVQFARLFVFIKNHRVNRAAASDEQRIDFGTLSANDLRLDLYDDIGVPHVQGSSAAAGLNPLLAPGTVLSDTPTSPELRPAAAVGNLGPKAPAGAAAGPSPFVLEK